MQTDFAGRGLVVDANPSNGVAPSSFLRQARTMMNEIAASGMKKTDPMALRPDNRTILVVGADASAVASRAARLIRESQAEHRSDCYVVVGSERFKEAIRTQVGKDPSLHFMEPAALAPGCLDRRLVPFNDLIVIEDFGSSVGADLICWAVEIGRLDVIGCRTVETPLRAESLLTRSRRRGSLASRSPSSPCSRKKKETIGSSPGVRRSWSTEFHSRRDRVLGRRFRT